MIVINVHGRLAHQPELKILGNGGAVCEFRLLSSRFAKGEEVTEAVTFFCFDGEAEKFCETAEKGQLISASGTQETSSYTDAAGVKKSFTKYRMTWHAKGARPRSSHPVAQGSDGTGSQRPTSDRYGAGRQAAGNTRMNGAGASRSGFAQGQQSTRPPQQGRDEGASHSQERRASHPGAGESSSGNDGFADFDDVTGFV
ncbi:single-stranded DNA-binding protein [Hydrogenophaga sp. BPS33]|uniref:single-stranded DNA-binding protein n=1 Tax=Hydrogenophaga sp. BPS33 TaxID=2651974 RepID=UPI0013200A1E|nr:single-stranded DNA-binding protein [Hydrogenophaga sp. BPS33]QHE89365.1 single-stranded DNA-binding protein [Hydrogenophaga sp. BPS33]